MGDRAASAMAPVAIPKMTRFATLSFMRACLPSLFRPLSRRLSRSLFRSLCLLVAVAACSKTATPETPVAGPSPSPSTSTEDSGARADSSPPLDAQVVDGAVDGAVDGPITLTAYPRRGSATDDTRPPQGPGLLLGGGGADVDAAFVWAHDALVGAGGSLQRGGDVLVLRAEGADGYDAYLDGLAAWNSVQTLRIPARATQADLAFAARAIDAAELVFFAGGNQGDYVAWRGTPLMRAVQALYARGGFVGGTSAGCAILGASVNDATLAVSESITSTTMMSNPYDPAVHFTQNMLVFPALASTVTDMHFAARDRMGRLVGFMARQVADGVIPGPTPIVYGVAVDESTTLVIDKSSSGHILRQRVTGVGAAYVVRGGSPDRALAGQPLVYRDLTVHRLDTPTDTYDFARHCGTGRGYPITAVGQAAPPGYEILPRDPYSATGTAESCP